jgi:ketosteroid isomerase-like protein
MKKWSFIIAVIFSIVCTTQNSYAQNKDIAAIQSILDNQIKAWNSGDLDAFMVGYLHSDSLVFIGKSGPTYGYDNTLANYKKSYPDKTHMGRLQFEIVSMKPLNNDHYFVIGKWKLIRTVGDLNGVYTLLLRKTKEGWKIIADHSS